MVLLLGAALAAQPRPVTIRGRIQDEFGAPLAGAGVVVLDAARISVDRALSQPDVVSAADGSFAVPALLEAGPVPAQRWMLVAAKGKAACLWRRLLLAEPDSARMQPVLDCGPVRLPRGVSFSGRVRDPEGRPLAGARVLALDLLTAVAPGAAGYGAQTFTDQQGTFVLRGVCADAQRLLVEAEGHGRRVLEPVNLGDPLDLVLARSGCVRGRLVDSSGQAVAGRVQLVQECLEGIGEPVDTAADGTFSLSLAFAAPWRVRGLPAGALAAVSSGQHEGSHADLLLGPTRYPGNELRVQASAAATRQPVPELAVLQLPFPALTPWTACRHPGWILAQRGTDRSFEIRSPAGGEVTYLRARGCAVTVLDDVRDAEIAVELAPTASMRGQVVDTQGIPQHDSTRIILNDESRPGSSRGRAYIVVAAPDGSFGIADLPAGKYRLSARHIESGNLASTDFTVAPGQPLADLLLRFNFDAAATVEYGCMALPADCRFVRSTPNVGNILDPLRPGPLAWSDEQAFAIGPGRRLQQPAAGLRSLHAMLPVAPRTGAALCMPLAVDDERRLLVPAEARPLEVRGRIRTPMGMLPQGRLVVAQLRVPSYLCRIGLVAPDGTYSLETEPGRPKLVLVDLVTGWRLASHQPEEATEGTLVWNPDLPLRSVRVEYRGRYPAAWALLVDPEEPRDCPYRERAQIGGLHGHPGIDFSAERQAMLLLASDEIRIALGTGRPQEQNPLGAEAALKAMAGTPILRRASDGVLILDD